MKLFIQYVKQRWRGIVAAAVFCLNFTVTFMLYRLPVAAVLYPTGLCAVLGIILILTDFRRVKRKHELLCGIQTITDAITGIMPQIDGMEDEDYQQIIRLLSDEHNRYNTETNRRYADMIDYYGIGLPDRSPQLTDGKSRPYTIQFLDVRYTFDRKPHRPERREHSILPPLFGIPPPNPGACFRSTVTE